MHPVHLYYLHHTERISSNQFEKFLSLLPDGFRNEIRAYKHWESAQASLLGKMLLLHLFKKQRMDYGWHDVTTSEKDRPSINADIDFNISHSGEYIIAALTSNASTGVDIEKHRPLDTALFRKYFSDDEWEWIKSSDINMFFDLWAVKESAIKCDGRGVEVLSRTHAVEKPVVSTSNSELLCDGRKFSYRLIDIEEGYSCSVCCDKDFQLEIEKVKLSDLL